MLSLYKQKISPMLAQIGSKNELRKKDFVYEPKLDGTRCILYKIGHEIRMLNRRGNWFHYRFPEIVGEAKKLRGNFILDGEVIVLDKKGLPSFNMLQSRDQSENPLRIKILAKQMPATLYLFDIIAYDNTDYTKMKLIDRKYFLNRKIPDNLVHIRKTFYTEGSGKRLWSDVKRFKIEGVMAKDKNSTYMMGKRPKLWLKIKNIKTTDAIICGYALGIREYFASLVLGQYHKGKLIHIGNVGTGFDYKQIAEIGKMLQKIKTKKSPFKARTHIPREIVWVEPNYVAEVEFLEYTKYLHLRAPSFKRLRYDKPLKECIVEK
jgi:DNA ligase D-like protein (predicted ligase)